ncbi:MAG TPA: flagellar basal-body rod protein FlgG [Burkholderiaceae bacterium]
MIRSLWIAKTGLDAQQTKMDVITNNLSHVGTSGFKRSRAVFEDLLYQNIRQPGAQATQQNQLPSGLQLGTGVRTVATERVFTQGNPEMTSNDFDAMINGDGFFQVLLPDGTNGYTRNGSFAMDQNGQLMTASGYVVQPPITIPPFSNKITIGSDGTVSVNQAGVPAPVVVGNLQLVTFMNPNGLQARGENLYVETGVSGTPSPTTPGTNGAGVLQQGYLESSNVNLVEEMVNMISTQRAYEINSKAITTSDQMLQKLSQL